MKLLIITSSIFYLLGLKLTNQVEIDKQSLKDSVQIKVNTQKELVLPKQETPELHQTCTEEDKTQIKVGSGEKTAPWSPEKETIEVK